MRILALTRYERLGSSSRVRFYQYFPYLQSQGVDVKIAPLLTDDYVQRLYTGKRPYVLSILTAYLKRVLCLLRSRTFDLLWIEKEILPWLPAWGEFLISRNIPYVVDYDDAIFHRYDLHQSKIIRALLSKKIDAVMRHATLVITGNDYLAGRAQKAGAKRVKFLPSVVDVAQYPVKKTKQGLNIGWIGSPATASFLNLIQPALKKSVNSSEVRLTLIGAGKIDPLPGVGKTLLPWSERTEITDLQTFDVGIMPLPDGPFERGKCGYKLIQYMASGLPVVASPVGVNIRIVEHGRTGFLASTQDEWLAALLQLQNNLEQRRQMGKAGRKKAEDEYNLQVVAPRLLDLFNSVV